MKEHEKVKNNPEFKSSVYKIDVRDVRLSKDKNLEALGLTDYKITNEDTGNNSYITESKINISPSILFENNPADFLATASASPSDFTIVLNNAVLCKIGL